MGPFLLTLTSKISINMKWLDRHQYLIFQILAHLVTVWAVFHYTWQDWLLAIPFYFILVGVGISITFHRLCTHHAYPSFPLWLKVVGLVCGTVVGQGTSIGWVTKHAQHHVKSDTEQDPHSPQWINPWKLYWANLLHGENVQIKYGITALRDPVQVWFHQWYWPVNLVYAVVMYYFGTNWLVFGYFVPATLGWLVTGYGVAIASHQWGYVTYDDTHDHSRNNPIVGILVFGEGYQNNHHKTPNRAILSHRWYELDSLGWIFKRFSQ